MVQRVQLADSDKRSRSGACVICFPAPRARGMQVAFRLRRGSVPKFYQYLHFVLMEAHVKAAGTGGLRRMDDREKSFE